MEILGIGVTGLVGSRIVELLSSQYVFHNLSLETGVDITVPATLEIISKATGEAVVLHLAAKADVDGCERDKSEDIKILGYKDIKKFAGLKTAWAINVEGTRNVVDAAQKAGKKIIYISTDFVFGGQNPPVDGYSEEDIPDPINWYAQTKYEGEKIVQGMDGNWLICRLAFPYRAKFEPKKDFMRAILSRLKSGEQVKAIGDQIVTPTFIDDIAQALSKLIEAKAQGIYHLVGSQFLSPYEAAKMIAAVFNYSENLVTEVAANEYFFGRAKRPFKLPLRNDKIRKLGVKMRTFEEGLEEIKRQMTNF